MPLGLARLVHSLGLGLWVLLFAWPLRAQGVDANISAGIESYREFTLANGLRVVIAVDHRVPQVALRIEYAVGDTLDPPEQRGLAQLIGAILPKLDTRHLRAVERPRLLQAAGFKFEEPGVQVTLDMTAVQLQVPSEALELALWMEADRMSFAADGISPALLADALPRALGWVERAPNNPEALTVFRAGLGRSHPYGGLDRPANLSNATATAVAQRLRRYYNPASAALVLVGDVDLPHAEEAVRRLFGPLTSAPLRPLPIVPRPAKPQLISLTAAVPARFSALVWETPASFADDDQRLDVVARVLTHRLTLQKLCDKITVGQRSRRLTSVFYVSCEAPKISSDVWRDALGNELKALAEGRLSPVEIEAAALRYSVIMALRYDDLFGRAQMIASSVLTGHGARAIPKSIQGYLDTDAARVAAVVRRHLLRPADGRVEVTPLASASAGGSAYFGSDSEPFFQVPAEPLPAITLASPDWPRPPANGRAHRFEPPTGPTDTLPNGDQLRFMEHGGVPVAHVRVQIPWSAQPLEPAARPVLAELLKKSAVDGTTLEDKLRLLGTELKIYSSADELELALVAPSSKLLAVSEALASVLDQKELPNAEFEAAKANTADWLKPSRDDWSWYWDALGLSAPKTRYAYLSSTSRKSSVARLKLPELTRLWATMRRQPRTVDLVGPFDSASARALGAKLARRGSGPPPAATAKRAIFRPGVYVFDRAAEKSATDKPAPESVEVCLLWPVPRWATPGHYPAHLVPWMFRTNTEDGFGARLEEHHAGVPYWQSNTLLNRDQDFLRYSFRVPIERLTPTLESLKVHLTRLGEDHFAAHDLANAIAAERQFQMRQALTGQSVSNALYRAASHDKQGNEALDIALQVERVTRQEFAALVKGLTFESATIGIIGPAARVTESLESLKLKPSTIVKLEVDAEGARER